VFVDFVRLLIISFTFVAVASYTVGAKENYETNSRDKGGRRRYRHFPLPLDMPHPVKSI